MITAGVLRHPDLGPQAPAVARLLQHRLHPNTIAAYASHLKPFFRFMEEAGVTDWASIDHHTIARYVAWMHEHPQYDLAPRTLRSYVSAIATVFSTLASRPIDTSHALVKSLFAAYANAYHTTHNQPDKRTAWPTTASLTCCRHLRDWIQRGTAGGSTQREALDAAQVVFATLTYCRGATSRHVRLEHITFTDTGFRVTLVEQKANRLRLDPPTRTFAATDPAHPVSVLRAFFKLRLTTEGPAAFAFGDRTLAASLDSVVKRVALRLRLPGAWSSHCVRIGACSAAHRLGVSVFTIAHLAGHASIDTTLGYIRHDVPADSAADQFFGSDLPRR